MDYETESQRECQDIIDSVDNVIDFEGLEETVDSNYSGPSPKKRVPQIDGSCDDFYSFPHTESAELSYELEKKNEQDKFSQQQAFHHAGRCSSSKKKMKSSSWGSLPFSTTLKEVDNSETKNFNFNDGSSSGDNVPNLVSSSFCTQNKAGNCLEISTEKLVSPPIHPKDANTLAECSVRDLMRKKRQHQFELYSSFGEQKEGLSLCPETKQLSEMLEENDGFMELRPRPCGLKEWSEVSGSGSSFETSTTITEKCGFSADVSSCKPDNLLSNIEFSYGEKLLVERLQPVDACNFDFTTSSLASELLCKEVCRDEQILRACSSSLPFENLESHDGANEATKEINFVCGKQEVGDDAGLSAAGATSAALDVVDESSCLISMSFHEKPPIVDGNYEALEDIALAKAKTDHSSLIPCTGFSGNN